MLPPTQSSHVERGPSTVAPFRRMMTAADRKRQRLAFYHLLEKNNNRIEQFTRQWLNVKLATKVEQIKQQCTLKLTLKVKIHI